MDKKSLKKRKKREEKKKHIHGKGELKKGFTEGEKKKGMYGIALILVMAAAAAFLGLYQLSS